MLPPFSQDIHNVIHIKKPTLPGTSFELAEETRVSVPAEARDEGVVAATTAQAVPKSVVPVVQLPDSSEEFRDSRDIDPAAAASAADKIAEFTSSCEEVLDEVTSEGPHHGVIIQSRVPSEFLHDEQEEEAV